MTFDKAQWAQESDAVLQWLVRHSFAGIDPFDALESRLFQRSPFAGRPLARLAWLQFHKRLPINLRPLVGVVPSRNAKTVGLVLLGLARQAEARGQVRREIGAPLVAWLADARAPGSTGWGYPFAWQNRAFYAPRGTPNAVCSAFVVAGLLAYAAATGDQHGADLAVASLPFWLTELRRSAAPEGFCFSYTPLDTSRIHNVNLLAAATVAQLGQLLRDESLIKLAASAAGFSIAHQRPDGSWPYGEEGFQGWVDSFHTGFVLGALGELGLVLRTNAIRRARQAGYDYFRRRLLDPAGLPRYYADRSVYPIDAHSVAQAIVTLLESRDLAPDALPLADRIATWAQQHLRRGSGVYSYRSGRVLSNRIVYCRWTQAWMFRALVEIEFALTTSGEESRMAGKRESAGWKSDLRRVSKNTSPDSSEEPDST